MKWLRHITNLFVFLVIAVSAFGQDSPEEYKEKADKLFEKEQYVEATPLYLHILSLDPRNAELNYKYGACLLFNSNKKKDAIRYLNYGVTDPNADPRAFYFRGKALHLDYQFEEAKKSYQEYLRKRTSKDDRYNVEREIEMCNNGKRLLTTFTDIIVANKQEIDQSKFYEIYTDSKTVGGDILVTARFQSKIDKKKGHVPIVHFGPNANAIYYSSYGDDLSTGKDIYVRRKLPDGQWGEPQKLPGPVNTDEDEDFPYLHPSGNFLYFSSKGHNSMGGYDVFMSRYNPETYQFEEPENVDFAISSPDDDLFYVVDSLFQNAYFASARQSQDGKLHVYKVKVVRVPVQEVIIMGDFVSDINPEDQKMMVTLTNHSNGVEVGKIKANTAKSGKYSFVFPQGGKYDYLVDVEGSEQQYKFTVELPFMDELRPLKQKILHTTEGGNEVVRIVNMFDEDVEGAEAVIAEIIRKKSELDVNLEQFDLEKIESEAEKDRILADLGYSNMSMNEVGMQLEELAESTEENAVLTKRLQSNIDSEILAKSERVLQLERLQDELTQKAANTDDPVVKYKLLTEAQLKQKEKEQLIDQIKGLEELKGTVEDVLAGDSGVDPEKIRGIENQFNEYLENDQKDKALSLLVENKDLISEAADVSPGGVVDNYTQKTIQLREKIKEDRQKRDEYRNEIKKLESEITILERELEGAKKKKDQERIQGEIDAKNEELKLYKGQLDKVEKRIADTQRELNGVEDQLASLQNAIETEQFSEVNEAEVAEAIEEIKNIEAGDSEDYEAQLAQLEKDHPEVNGGTPIEDAYTAIENSNQQEEEKIVSDPSLSELEQTYRLIENNEETISQVEERISAIDESLANGADDGLQEEKQKLEEYKQELEAQNEQHAEKADSLKEQTPDAALSKEDVIREVSPSYEEDLASIESNPALTEKEKLESVAEIQRSFISDVEKELTEVDAQLNDNPENQEVLGRKEILEEIKRSAEADLEETQRKLDQIVPDVAVEEQSREEIVNEIAPDYNSEIAAIEANDELSEEEKLEAEITARETFREEVTGALEDVNKTLEQDPENETATQRKNTLEEILEETNEEVKDAQTALEKVRETTEPALTVEEVVNDIAPDYEEEVRKVEDGDASQLEKEKALLVLDQRLKEDLEKEKENVEKKLSRKPDNEELKQRLEAIESAESQINNEIAEREQTVNALQNVSSVPDEADERKEVIEAVLPGYEEELAAIDQSSASDYEKQRSKASVTAGLLEKLKEEQSRLEKELKKQPDDAALQSRKEIVDQLIGEQEQELETLIAGSVSALQPEDKEKVIEELSPEYFESVESASTMEEIVTAEKGLQEQLEKEIANIEKQQKRKYSVTVEIEKRVLEQLLEESKEREAVATDSDIAVNDDAKKESFIETLRKDVMKDTDAMKSEATTKTELEEQDAVLAAYEEELEERIADTKSRLENQEDEETQKELEWLEEEQEQVKAKRHSIRVSIGELETEVIASTTDDPELNTLAEEEQDLLEQLDKEDLSNREKKELNRELDNVREKQTARENEILEAAVESSESKGEELSEELSTMETNDPESELVTDAKKHYESSDAEIESIMEEADNADSEAERNFLLREAEEKREKLNSEMEEVIRTEKINTIEEENEISVSSGEDLEKKKRRYIVRIGEISREIAHKNEEIEDARKKDVPALEKEREQLEDEKELLEAQVRSIDSRLKEEEKIAPAVHPEAMDESVTFNEERKIAASDAYKEYQPLAEEALKVENEIRTLEAELEEERKAIQRMVDEGEEEETIQLKARKIKQIESDIDRLNVDLVQKRWTAEQALPENEDEAMKMQNLVARGIRPIKVAAVATAILQMPSTGFSIDTSSTRPNAGLREIPVDVESPSGLVYRVQVGAFAKPLREDVFREFNPVSGEKIEGTNITRYMAGYFSSSETVVEAREQIRSLGYSDAFIVAYCDGKRVYFGEARRMEEAGTCVPKGSNEIMIEVAEKTADKMGIPLTAELEEVPELTYNQAPGAVQADPIENMQGLFFTVQIGVFNRPISEKDVFSLPEIFTIRLPNGQIRYSTGKFDSVEEAAPRMNQARASGVNGAFIVAYYKGERISIANAKRLLSEYGESILQSEMEKQTPVESVETPVDVVRTDTVTTDVVELPAPTEKWEQRIQIVTKKQFDEFPRDVLNRYNAEGFFYYDESDKRVKSVVYKNEDHLPRLWNFKDDIDTVYLPVGQLEDEKTEILSVTFKDSIIPGDFMDWMLRLNYRRAMSTSYKGAEVRIFGVPEEKLETLKEQIRVFGVEPEVIKEEEELEENN